MITAFTILHLHVLLHITLSSRNMITKSLVPDFYVHMYMLQTRQFWVTPHNTGAWRPATAVNVEKHRGFWQSCHISYVCMPDEHVTTVKIDYYVPQAYESGTSCAGSSQCHCMAADS